MQRIAVSITVDSHRGKAKVATGPDDTERNLSSIRDKYFLEWPFS
jgi:hypothetical protein